MFFLKDLPSQEMVSTYAVQFPELVPEKTQNALQMLRQASVLMRNLDRYFASHNVSQTQFLILIILHRDPTKTQHLASEIAVKMDISKPVLSTAIKTLLKRGLIAYSEKQSDGRAKPLNITPAGVIVLRTLLPEYFKILQADI